MPQPTPIARTPAQIEHLRAVITGALEQLDCTDGQTLTLQGALGALNWTLGADIPQRPVTDN